MTKTLDNKFGLACRQGNSGRDAGNGRLPAWTAALVALGCLGGGSGVHAEGTNRHDGFFTRFDKAYREQLSSPAYEAPATNAPPAQRRGLPAPFDAPPYPTAEWQLGGTPIIGDPNTIPTFPLSQALFGNPNWGDALKNSGVKIYGWEDISGNLSSSHNTANGQLANFPMAYDSRANRIEQNQLVLYIDKTPDEFQTDHVDWGFRYSAVYGLDYRYMISRGFISGQLIRSGPPGTLGQPAGQIGSIYGLDMPMMYGDIYIPSVAEGMNIRIGRMISAADIEAQLAPNNLMSSHSLLYAYDPYTQWGVLSTIKLNNQWTIQLGLSDGNDVAPWQSDPGRQLTGTVMVQYQSPDGKLSFYGGGNAFNNGQFGYNNLQQYVGTWTYKFNERIWTSWETWYMYQNNATTGPTYAVPYQNGSFPVRPGYAPEWATLDYTMVRLGAATFLTFRNEYFDDCVGNRTGYATCYEENAVGITWWPSKLLTIRPEIRFDHAFNLPAYDNGTRKNQFTASVDAVFYF